MAIGCMLGLARCTVGPTYTQPELHSTVPDTWHHVLSNEFTIGNAHVSRWWYAFDDPALVALIVEAQQSNVSLQIAVSNLMQARSAFGVASSAFAPKVHAKGGAQREQASDNSTGLANFPAVTASPTNDFSVGLDASWEIDLWGGIAKNVEAASATVTAELEQFRDTLVTVRAETASAYINIRVLQVKKKLLNMYIDTLKAMLMLYEEQYKQGVLSRVELEQERALYDQGTTALPEVDASLVQEIARLSVLLGTEYKSTAYKVSGDFGVPTAKPSFAIGIPSELIRRRPDIRSAERALAAETALIGSKMSDLYPKLSLSGSFGYEATTSHELLRWESRSYAFGPTVSWDIFNGDRIRSQIQMQEEKTYSAYLQWELTVLNAFAEVETTMSNLIEAGKIQDSLNDASKSMLIAELLTEDMVHAGVQEQIALLQAKQNLINAELALVEQTGLVDQQIIALYKALGGDWESDSSAIVTSLEHARTTK